MVAEVARGWKRKGFRAVTLAFQKLIGLSVYMKPDSRGHFQTVPPW